MYKIYSKLDLKYISCYIKKYWNKHNIFDLNNSNNNINELVFFEGPPSVNGSPGIHHLYSIIAKDIFYRYKILCRFKINRQIGWDTHGLPIELYTENKLKICKNDIGNKITISEYNYYCKKYVNKNISLWEKLIDNIGCFINLKNNYVTYDSKYIETIWWIIYKIYNKGLLYKSYCIQPYSPVIGTAISHHELNFPGVYKKKKTLSIFVLFKIKDSFNFFKFKNVYIVVWTTTPWTLPANSALAINKNCLYNLIITYCKYNLNLIKIVISKSSLYFTLKKNKYFLTKNINLFKNKYFLDKKEKIPFYILKEITGSYLLNLKYYRIMNWDILTPNNKFFSIFNSDKISCHDGTGIMHVAPTFGELDDKISKKYNIFPVLVKRNKNKYNVPIVNKSGRYNSKLPHKFRNKFIYNEYDKNKNNNSVNIEIIKYLKNKNLIFNEYKYKHYYPYCWRSNKPIIYYPVNSWFIKTTSIKKKLISINEKINWIPDKLGNNRFKHWLKNIKDWNLSRSRYWGTPLPIWRSLNDCNDIIIIYSVYKLYIEINRSIIFGYMTKNPFKKYILDYKKINYKYIDLHKHILDKIILTSHINNEPMIREDEIIDVWFDSGAVPYASKHYPYGKIKNINKLVPSIFISEGIDQLRGWFFTLHVISTIISNSMAYKNVLPTGLVLDNHGKKMSKSKLNTLNPFIIINKYSPDVVRWYFTSNNISNNIKFNINNFDIIYNKVFNTLYNVYRFFSIYANIDKFKFIKYKIIKPKNILDIWILSKLNKLIKNIYNLYDNYKYNKVIKNIEKFIINNFSNWYIRLSRNRFWKNNYDNDKYFSYTITYICLLNIIKLMSPISPFFCEFIYINLTKKKSIYITKFPKYKLYLINKKIEKIMNILRNICNISLSIRKKVNIKVRQPLSEMYISILNNKYYNLLYSKYNDITYILKKELNIKLIYIDNKINYNYNILIAKPKYKYIGPKFKKFSNIIYEFIKKMKKNEILNLYKFNSVKINIFDKIYCLNKDDIILNIVGKYNWVTINKNNNIVISLNTYLSNSLLIEGAINDLVNKIQNIRKNINLNITDSIYIYISCNKNIQYIINDYINHINNETLSKKIYFKNFNNIKKYSLINFLNNDIMIYIIKV